MSLRRGNLFVVGLMGAGKTTHGPTLARRLDLAFVDADHALEEAAGLSIPAIFAAEGEAGFRVREAAVIEALTQRTGIVLATGGGAVLLPANRERLRRNGTVLYLHATPQTLWRRARRRNDRPLLQVADPQARMHELYTLRDPLYRAVADAVVEADARAIEHWIGENLERVA